MNETHGIAQWMIHLLWEDTVKKLGVVALIVVGIGSLARIERARRAAGR
ncbi:hypothetical protein ACIF6L_20375 [Kitasatospora sp. NPDC086009]